MGGGSWGDLLNWRGVLSGTDVENLRNSFHDANEGGDILFWLYATCVYAAVRIGCELLFPGKVRGYTVQQYMLCMCHQALILPALAICWAANLVPDAEAYIYLATGAYLASDSIINYTPVSGCVAGRDGSPVFSWGVQAHHLFTVILCALGTALPPWPVKEGAVCILLGEAGSLWISVALLRPTPLNFAIRYNTFVISRVCGVLIALDIARQLENGLFQLIFVGLVIGLCYDNWCRAPPRHAAPPNARASLPG